MSRPTQSWLRQGLRPVPSGGGWVSRDRADAPDGMHDFDVNLSDGRCIALEVTGAINQQVVRLSQAAHGTVGRERRWPGPGLANDWLVVIPQRPSGSLA